MKKIVFLSLVVALFAAACSSNKNGIITKRKYTKGYFVDFKGRNKHQVKENDRAVTVKSKLTRPATETKQTVVVPAEQTQILASVAKPEFKSANEVKPVTAAVNSEKTRQLLNTEVKPSLKSVLKAKMAMKKMTAAKSGADADTNLILLVILSLFPILALVAIYLHDGKQITLNFWVDLILHFLFLYWLFALLVVLDVFSLA